jgi:dTDP-4-dehydrorhamnose reductase/dTDP-4-dehydrorhamnose 3,5-epimerase
MADPAGLPRVTSTPVPGLLVVDLDLRGDARGFFKENWQRAKMTTLGLPDFGPVQNNISFNGRRGVTRGIHAEPWDKFVSVASGRVFGAWVDLREGPSFGTTYTHELGPETAVFVPRGVGNSYQVLEDATAYSYLVNRHWRPDATYTELALDDATAAIDWPIALDHDSVERSQKDLSNPQLADVTPMAPAPMLVIGHRGQLGRAVQRAMPAIEGVDIDVLDLTDPASVAAFDFSPYAVVVNAAAYTAVDAAETDEGRPACWAANATGPAVLARLATEHGFTLVHVSSDYVFDGTRDPHTEDEPLAPLGVYGQSKAAGDLAVSAAARHYLLRTTWLIGDGHNFVRTMQKLAADGVSPTVVDDQVGRLTFADELARAVRHLLEVRAPYGTYNLTNGGESRSWAGFAAAVFEASGRSGTDVTPTSTEAYAAGKVIAPRPALSTMSLAKIRETGFEPTDVMTALHDYLDAAAVTH